MHTYKLTSVREYEIVQTGLSVKQDASGFPVIVHVSVDSEAALRGMQVLQCVAVCCSVFAVLQCAAECRIVLQCVAVRCSEAALCG